MGGAGGGLGGAITVGAAKSVTADEGIPRLLATEAARFDMVETASVACADLDEPSRTTVTEAWAVDGLAKATMEGMVLPRSVLRAVVALAMFRIGAAGNGAPESTSTSCLASNSAN